MDTKHLQDKPVLFRMTRSNAVYSGIVKQVESAGVWIETTDLLIELAQDAAWKKPYQQFVGKIQARAPQFFVPFATLQFLVAPPD